MPGKDPPAVPDRGRPPPRPACGAGTTRREGEQSAHDTRRRLHPPPAPLPGLAARHARAVLRLVRRAVAMVGGRPRRLLGQHPRARRHRLADAAPRGARRGAHAGRGVVSRPAAELRAPGAAPRRGGARRRHAGHRRRGRDRRGDRAVVARAAPAGRVGRARPARARRAAAATASPPTCPTGPETIVAFLACASLGAIWSVCAPDMGTAAVADRFRQLDPKLLDRRRRRALRRPAARPQRGAARAARAAADGRQAAAAAHAAMPPRRCRPTSTGPTPRRATTPRCATSSPSGCRSTTRCGSSIRAAPPACRRRSCTATAASSSTRTSAACTTTSAPATTRTASASASTGTARPAG